MFGRVLPTAMCVRGVDDLCVLQFTLIIAAGCALHPTHEPSDQPHRIVFCTFRQQGQRGSDSPPALTPTLKSAHKCKRRGTLTGLRGTPQTVKKARGET